MEGLKAMKRMARRSRAWADGVAGMPSGDAPRNIRFPEVPIRYLPASASKTEKPA